MTLLFFQCGDTGQKRQDPNESHNQSMTVLYQQTGIIAHGSQRGQQFSIETRPVLIDTAALCAGNYAANHDSQIGNTESCQGKPVRKLRDACEGFS